MKNKALYISVILCLLAMNTFAQKKSVIQKKSNPLVGHWITNVLKEQKIKITMYFDAKGNIQYTVAVPLKGSYIKRGNKIITMFDNPKTGGTEVDTSEIRIKGDTLYQINHVGVRETVIKSVRIKGRDGLIGTWISENYNGYHARQKFNSYNSLSVDIIVKSIKGKYTVDENKFTIKSKDHPSMTIKFTLNNKKDVLTMGGQGVKEKLELIKVKEK
ncbi:MAG: hypothetical protein WB996_05810 [Ignavibacteriaceae bacterium]